MSEQQRTSSKGGGVGLPSLIGVAFIVLKLTHVVNWSWWWVLSPFWISATLYLLVLLGAIVLSIWLDKP